VLEGHIRKLASKCGLALADGNGRAKSVEALGVELRKSGELTEVRRKTVQAWYAQRNEAAHGRTDRLENGDVARMLDGVRDFISYHPA
jgi:hypothetical protein